MTPVTFPPVNTSAPVSFMDPLRGKGRQPIPGGRYGASRDYGPHLAEDYPGARGTPVYSGYGSGRARVGRSRLGGNMVTVDHPGGYQTRYMHLDGVNVKDGQEIGPDDVIGLLGMSGRATGPNLHYQILHNGKPINPADYRRR